MLAIVGGKGGCGKTTTALGLARELGRSGPRPLVVDADCDMPNLHTLAETDRRPGVGAVETGARIERALHRSQAFPGVDVLPAGDASASIRTKTLERFGRLARPVIVDCPAGATEAVATPLRVADDAVVVSTATNESLVDAAKTARMVQSLGTELLGGVVTHLGDESGSGPARSGPLREQCPILATVPEIPTDLLHSRVGRASYERLAQRLSSRNV